MFTFVTPMTGGNDVPPHDGDGRRRYRLGLGWQLYLAQDPVYKTEGVYSCHKHICRDSAAGERKGKQKAALKREHSPPKKSFLARVKLAFGSDPGEGLSKPRNPKVKK